MDRQLDLVADKQFGSDFEAGFDAGVASSFVYLRMAAGQDQPALGERQLLADTDSRRGTLEGDNELLNAARLAPGDAADAAGNRAVLAADDDRGATGWRRRCGG